MAVATFELIGRGEPFVSPHGHSPEASSFYLVAASAVALLGPGRFSLDALLFGRVAPDAPLPLPSNLPPDAPKRWRPRRKVYRHARGAIVLPVGPPHGVMA